MPLVLLAFWNVPTKRQRKRKTEIRQSEVKSNITLIKMVPIIQHIWRTPCGPVGSKGSYFWMETGKYKPICSDQHNLSPTCWHVVSQKYGRGLKFAIDLLFFSWRNTLITRQAYISSNSTFHAQKFKHNPWKIYTRSKNKDHCHLAACS